MTYTIDRHDDVGPDEPIYLRLLGRFCAFASKPLIFNWSVTQYDDVKQQLNGGIRYNYGLTHAYSDAPLFPPTIIRRHFSILAFLIETLFQILGSETGDEISQRRCLLSSRSLRRRSHGTSRTHGRMARLSSQRSRNSRLPTLLLVHRCPSPLLRRQNKNDFSSPFVSGRRRSLADQPELDERSGLSNNRRLQKRDRESREERVAERSVANTLAEHCQSRKSCEFSRSQAAQSHRRHRLRVAMPSYTGHRLRS